MKWGTRMLLVILVTLIAHIYLRFLILPRILKSPDTSVLPTLVSLVMAIGIGLLVFQKTATSSARQSTYILRSGIIVGILVS